VKWCGDCQFFVESDVCESCGRDYTDTATLVDGRYRLQSKIGEGGMGEVYSALDVTLDRRAAIKFLRIQATPLGLDKVRQFRREASAIAAIRSDFVAHIYSFGVFERRPFFAMEYVEGSSLSSLMNPAKAQLVPPLRSLALARDVAIGLGAVHATGMVHCDVKPSNIVIEVGTGRPVLVDFGIAMLAGSRLDDDISINGTPSYMAPEQAIPEHPIVAATDVYALGCTLFEMLTGRVPYSSPSLGLLVLAHVNAPIPSIAAIAPELAPVEPIIMRALAKDPNQRFPTALSLAHAIDSVMPEFVRGVEPQPNITKSTATSVGLRALVIDDEPMISRLTARAVETAFRSIDVIVDVASSGDEALERWQSAPDLVVLDLHMPGLDGTETLAHFRERKRGAQLRAIAWTARPVPEAVRRFKALGVETVLQKPLTFQRLVSELREVGLRSGWILPESAAASATGE